MCVIRSTLSFIIRTRSANLHITAKMHWACQVTVRDDKHQFALTYYAIGPESMRLIIHSAAYVFLVLFLGHLTWDTKMLDL
jgi:hypothetical protein